MQESQFYASDLKELCIGFSDILWQKLRLLTTLYRSMLKKLN